MLLISDYKKILFSDIDGTFAGNDMDYMHGSNSIAYLNKNHILLVLVSSKPVDPILKILKDCNADLPFIFENGGGIYLPNSMFNGTISSGYTNTEYKDGSIIQLGHSLLKVKSQFNTILANFPELEIFYPDNPDNFEESLDKYRMLFDTWEDNIIRESVMTSKFFDLAFYIENEKFNREKTKAFLESLRGSGLEVTKGGIFYHVTCNANKGTAVKLILKILNNQNNQQWESIGIGDGNNDLPFLKEVDSAYLLYNKNNKHIETDLKLNNLSFINLQGPQGFIQLIQELNQY